jgi:hypothetical protein
LLLLTIVLHKLAGLVSGFRLKILHKFFLLNQSTNRPDYDLQLFMNNTQKFGTDVSKELEGLAAEPRLVKRSQKMLKRWQERPGLGFPQIFKSDAELEAAYRFFNNPSLSFEELLTPHVAQSVARCRDRAEILCIQDSTTFVFSGDREGLGYINKNNRGFIGHFALAVTRSQQEMPVPLGIVAARTWIREQPRDTKGISQHKLRESRDCESLRWLETVEELEDRFNGIATPIHVMDREADIYDCTSTMVAKNYRFVVRCKSNRIVEAKDPKYHLLFDKLDGLPVRYNDTITVTPRKGSRLPDQRKKFPARDGREANICVASTTVTVKRSRNSPKEYPETTTLNLVHLFEPNPPANQPPIEWILLTNEPCSNDDELRAVIDCYRQRWLIEEFNKAIKTGCIFEKRQLESYDALTKALALTLPIAWEMLLLRTQSRSNADMPAEQIIFPMRLQIIRAHAKRYKLPENPTLRDVAYAIAGLGGHLKRNGPPGWQTLRRGYEEMLTLEAGWMMALSTRTCDQS